MLDLPKIAFRGFTWNADFTDLDLQRNREKRLEMTNKTKDMHIKMSGFSSNTGGNLCKSRVKVKCC